MNLLFFSDLHASVGNLDRCEQTLEHILQILKKEDVQGVFCGGDLKTSFNPIDVRVTNFLVHFTQEIVKHCPLNVLLGNHDLIQPRDGVPSILPVMESAGAKIYDTPTKVPVIGLTFWMLPYQRDILKQEQALRFAHESTSKDIVCFHNEVTGCKSTLWRKGQGIDIKHFPKHCLCIGGHIHHQQQVAPNIWYTGSPFHNDWGEANETKGFLLVRTSPNGKHKVEQIASKLPGWYDPSKANYIVPKSWKDCQVRVSVPVGYDPLQDLSKARSKLQRDFPNAKLTLIPVVQEHNQTGLQVDAKSSDYDLTVKYCDTLTMPEGGFQKGQVVNAICEIVRPGTLGVQPVKFKTVTGTNVLCFEKVELDLDRGGVVLVTGENKDWPNRANGCGKSALLSILFIALFGKTPKGQTHDSWARRGASGASGVSQDLELANGSTLTVLRARKPGSLIVRLDGKDVTLGDINGTQRYIESVTNLTWEVLQNSVYIGQEEIGSVFGTDKDRKELFSRLLGLDRFLDAQQVFAKKLSKANKNIDWFSAEVDASKAACQESYNAAVSINSLLYSMAKSDFGELQRLEGLTAQLMTEQYALGVNGRDVDRELEQNQREFEELLDKYIRADTTIEQLKAQLNQTAGVRGKCPLCGSTVSVQHLEKHGNQLEKEIDKQEKEITKHRREKSNNRAIRADMIQQHSDIIKRWNVVDKQYKETEASIQALKALNSERSRLETLLNNSKRRTDKLLKNHEIHKSALEYARDHKAFIELCMKVVGRNGLPAFLCESVAPQLNAAAIRYSSLFSDSEIGIEFVMKDGDIDITVNNQHGGETIKDQSKGETRIAALIAAFSFRDVLVPHNILILDEPSEGLDAENSRNFARGLSQVAERFGTVFVVTHNQNLLSELKYDHHLEVVKENGVSQVFER